MKKLYLLFLVAFYATITNAQVTGTKTIGVDYATIAAAVTALNTSGVGAGGATINVPAAYAETVPSGGIVLGSTVLNATLTAVNTLTFVKTGTGINPALTAFTGGTSTTSDGIFKIQGADYVTINGLDLKENATNTGAALMEWGYAMVNLNAAAPFDGVQNLTIQNCTITLNKTNPNASMGIYGANNIATNATALAITAPADVHSNNKFYSNTITNAGFGFFIGNISTTAPAAVLFGQNNDVGGASSATGNTVTNIGGPAGFNVFAIYVSLQNGVNASNNTVSGVTAASGTAVTYGVYFFGATGTATANNNNITVSQSAATGVVAGIYAANTGSTTATGNTIAFTDVAGSATHYGVYCPSVGTVNISNNTFRATNTGACTGTYNFVYQSAVAAGGATLNDNIFDNINTSTTAIVYLIYASSGTLNLTANNNRINGTFTKTGAGGTVYGIYNNGSPASGTFNFNGNNLSNITLTGATAFYGSFMNTATGQIVACNNNTIANVTTGAAPVYGLYPNYGAAGSTVNGNTVSGLTSAGTTLYGIQVGSTAPLGITISNNSISGLTATSAATVNGILVSGGTNQNIFKNKISDLTGNNAGAVVYGLTIAAGTTSSNVYNNLIGDLKAPASTNTADAVRGINITSTSTGFALNVYNNTVHLNANSTGANFSTSALFATTSTTATTSALTLRNNILYNNSVPKGTGFTSAYRRSSATLTNYAAASNNNLFYAGAGCTNNAMFYNGTTGYNTMPAVQTALAPRDANSVTELSTPFLSTTGVGPAFLHLNTTSPTAAQGGGSPIALVTDDYDGDVRNATTPDIGADEFAGVSPTACAGAPTAGSISGTNNICQGSSTVLTLTGYTNASGINIQWQSSATSGGPYTNIACANGATYNTGVIPLGTTVYYVVVVTCANGGAQATTAQFAVTSNPTPVIAFTPAAPNICVGGSGVSITASGASTYTWSPATGLSATTGATVNANPAATTIYTVIGISAAGCPGTGTVTVTANTPPGTPVITPASGAICLGGVQQLNAAAGGSGTILVENFNTVPVGAIPAGWVKNDGSTGQGGGNVIWSAQASTNALGTVNEMRLDMNSSSSVNDIGNYSLKTPSLSAAGVTGVTLTFKSMLNHYNASFPYSIKVQTSTDNVTWTDRWVFTPTGTTAYTPTVENVSLSAIDNQGVFYVRWAGDGNVFGSRYWYVDDVSITGTAVSGVVFSPLTGLYTNAAATTPYTGAVTTTVYASPAATTTYTATATGAGGCTSATNVVVSINTPPSITTAPADQAVCAGNTATFTVASGGTAPFTYQWQVSTDGGGTWGPLAGQTNITLNITGTTIAQSGNRYRVAVTNGCSSVTSASALLTVTTPANATISYPSSPYCAGTGIINVTRTGTAGGTYSSTAGLSLNASTGAVDLAATTAGTYTVTYTVAATGGCPLFTTTASITVNVNSVAPAGATASTPVICGASGTVNLTATGGTAAPGATYRWYTGSCGGTPFATGATVSNVFVNQTTTYYVRIEGICNNTTCASVTVTVNPAVNVVLTAASFNNLTPATSPSQLLATVSPPGNYTYSWTKNGVILTNNTASPVIYLDADSAGTYDVRVTNIATGCSALSNSLVIYSQPSSDLFISPNPNNGKFTVRYYSDAGGFGKTRTVSVYDNKGGKVFYRTATVNSNYTKMNVDISQHAGGSYYVVVTDAAGKVLANGLAMVQK